jgi:hypothetical protein
MKKKLALIFLGLNLNAYCQTIGVERLLAYKLDLREFG